MGGVKNSGILRYVPFEWPLEINLFAKLVIKLVITEFTDIKFVNTNKNNYLVPPVQPTPFVTTTTLSPDSCSNTRIDWVPVPTERSIDKYYIHRNGQNIATVHGSSISYIDTDSLYLNTVYEYSVVAASCAGNSTVGSTNTFSIKGKCIIYILLYIYTNVSTVEAS